MAQVRILRPDEHAAWMDALAHTSQHDFYFLPPYLSLAEERGEGDASLFVFTEGEYVIALPLLLRSLEGVAGLDRVGRGWQDATSVYGYAGPVTSHSIIPDAILHNFRTALHKALQERSVVAVFSRLHPLIPQNEVLCALGDTFQMGRTVSIDLTLSASAQRERYRRDHRYGINKLRRLEIKCLHDEQRIHLDEFIEIYYESMQRVNASENYFFEPEYFKKLMSDSLLDVHLFVCSLGGRIICGALFSVCDGIVQYHLAGTKQEFLKLAPMKLLLDEVRLWASDHGAKVLHLGGGVGSTNDSLFEFKAGFSDRTHEFNVWQWIVYPEVYAEICQQKALWNKANGLDAISSRYFPEYRRPTVSQSAHSERTELQFGEVI